MPIGWGISDDKVSKQALYAALDAGINFFDTADIYGLGHSENILGKFLQKDKKVIIATKVGNVVRNDQFTVDYSKEYIINACEQSLKRLKRDVIDYYQLHSARVHHLLNDGCVDAMKQLTKQGKIRYWGLSLNTFRPDEEALYLMENNLADGFQLVFNILNQKAYDLIKKAGEKQYGIIARMPLQFGLLTGKFDVNTEFTKNDHRSFRLTPEILKSATDFLKNKVWSVAEKENLTKTQLALSFILTCPQITTVIPGLRTPDQVKNNTSGIRKLNSDSFKYLLGLSTDDELKNIVELMESAG
jgi:aryl-alcohol dehydrogenase-like predicted oxidoreductase